MFSFLMILAEESVLAESYDNPWVAIPILLGVLAIGGYFLVRYIKGVKNR